MSDFIKGQLLALALLAIMQVQAQTIVKGKIIDATTKEPVAGATIHCTKEDCKCGCTTNASGEFEMRCMDCESLAVTAIGYARQTIRSGSAVPVVYMIPAPALLQDLVVSASRGEAVQRAQAPVAIALISAQTLQDTRPAMADQVLNKVSGVNMVNLGNEQHQMSIRQPMTTKSLFLYLEDGIPIRTTGLYNHNALLEMNLASVKNIEVIKGPSSSLYGSEAIGGVVNFITAAPTAQPVAKVSVQGNSIGYKRADVLTGFTQGKLGVVVSGYYANRRNGYLEYSDFHKATATVRLDYRLSEKTLLSNSATWLDYNSDMSGGIDSAMFASRTFANQQTFTYRAVKAFRYHSTLTHRWSDRSASMLTALYRSNAIGQNPAYRVKDDYRRVGAVFVGSKELAHGEINESAFNSYALIAQHRQSLGWKKAVLIAGASADFSPSRYRADYIRIRKDTVTKKYVSYQPLDSVLTNYATDLNNYAAFINFECSPLDKLRLVASLRYDYFRYGFDNSLKPSAFSGSPDTISHFRRLSPKLGFTYNFSGSLGVYANYSEGFVPPQVTELYTGVKVPDLNPSVFYNYEVGGWVSLSKNRLSADVSVYRLIGTNEIISVKQNDGSFANQNAGRTSHQGIELGLNATPMKDISFRFSGAYSRHRFEEFIEKGVRYNGNEMNNAPNWLYNAEVWYKPQAIAGLRLGIEWQHVGSYFVDPQNTALYKGYNVLNARAGYRHKAFDVWVNVLNATDNYYSYITSKSASGYSYQLAEPLNVNIGLGYDLADLFTKK